MLDIKRDEPLLKYTTFRLGGPAKFFVVANTAEEVEEALNWARENNQKYFIIGGGSNLLFSDAGFDGLVIKIAIKDIEINGNELSAGSPRFTVVAGAGAPLFLAIKKSIEAGLAGLENLTGIPGTVGGAVANNAGAYGKSISDVLTKAEILISPSVILSDSEGSRDSSPAAQNDKYKIEVVDKSWFEYEYRASKIKYWSGAGKPVILRAKFLLQPGAKENLEQRIMEIVKTRATKEPKGLCAGCAFKNIKGPAVAEILERYNFSPDEKNLFFSRQAIPSAWFIDRAELKGKKIGGAYIPAEHANYVMNDGTAKSEDVITMISYVKQQVRDKFGVQLEEEVEIVL